ncbi:MAG: hypothetical protein K1X74_23235 [Pirellulales bacterium]|nr:hypothetical protein [Pirellulales bacterium]
MRASATFSFHWPCLGIGLAALFCFVGPAQAQAPKGTVKPTDPPPALTYHGLIPGLSSADEVRQALGPPVFEAEWYAYKLLYNAQARPDLTDSVHLHGKNGTFACVEAASIPPGYESKSDVQAKLGACEQEIRTPTFSLLDYTAKGVRFVFNKHGQTIGVAYTPHLQARVPDGGPRLFDLSGLREGPQPAPARPADLGDLKAGAAQVKISPTTGKWLNPRLRDAFTIHDDMYARCVVFEKGGQRFALVGADLFGMSRSDIEPMRARVAKNGVAYMVLAMSHNHAAPDTIGVYGHYPAEYIQYIQNQVVDCVAQAVANLQPVKDFRAASRELPMDGGRVIGYFRNARNVGLVDPTLSVLQPVGADGRPIATIVNFACHVEGLEAGAKELSADFPGYMCDQIKADGGGQAVFLNGAVGGMVSGDNRERTHGEAKTMGLGLAALVKQLAATAQPPARFDFGVDTRVIEFPMTNPAFKLLYAARGGLKDGRVSTEMALIKLGEAQLLTLPGEVLPEVGFEMQTQMTGFPRILIGLANDELGYIIPEYDFRSNSYEETMSQGRDTAPAVKQGAQKLLSGAP